MPNFLSAGVAIQENVLSASFPSFSTSSAAIVGYSNKGRLDVPIITTPAQFLQEYTIGGQVPLGSNFHYSALAYLQNGTQLYVQRVAYTDTLYSGARIKTSTSSQTNAALSSGASTTAFTSVSGNQDLFEVFSKDPGAWGNNISVQVTNIQNTSLPYTFEIDVYLTNPYNGVTTLVEAWTMLSRNQTALDGYGNPMYFMTKINGYSQYIVVADNTTYANTIVPKSQATNLSLAGGVDSVSVGTDTNGSNLPASQVALGWFTFTNKDNYDVRILINAGYTGATVQSAMLAVVDSRMDCIALFDHPFQGTTSPSSTVAQNVVTFRTSTQNFNDQRAALYSPWLKINDNWNNQIVYVPPSGYVASAYAYNDYIGDVWMSPAGFTRGVLDVLGTSTVYSQGDRDLLYPNQINPIQTFRGSGIVIYGDKNETATPGIFDRINVRRLIDIIEMTLKAYLRQFLFENNIPLTRTKVASGILTYLAGLYSQGAFNPIGPTGQSDKGYAVICDTTNNTPATISAHTLYVDVYVRPAQSINFILLRMNVMDSQVSITTLSSTGTLL